MRCKNCGGEWNPPKNISLTVCPFCNTPIIEKSAENKILQPYEIIKNIVDEYGKNILNDNKKLLALLMDLFIEKTKEKNILSIAINAGVARKILDSNNSNTMNKDTISEQCKLDLCEDYGMDEKWAAFAVYCFTYALGWKNNAPPKNTNTNINIENQHKYIENGLSIKPQNSLKDIVLQDNTTPNKSDSITSKLFKKYRELKKVTIPLKAPDIELQDNFVSNTIPSNINTIQYRAFENNKDLVSIIIPNSVTHIENEAFIGCKNLKSIDIPSSVISIGDGAFKGCTNLINISVNKRNTKYSSNNGMLFSYDKTKLLSYPSAIIANIPEGVSYIGNNAFGDCENLTSIIIPRTVKSIEYNAFWGCNNLKTIIIDKNNLPYSSNNGMLFDYYKTRLISYPSAFTIDVPDTVTHIGYGAFGYCKDLIHAVIPNNITSIGNYAFEGCTNLKSIFISEKVSFIGDSAFDKCINLVDIVVDKKNLRYSSENGMLFSYDKTSLFNYPSAIIANIPEGVIHICDSAFLGCKKLKRVSIPKSVASIGYMSFAGCENLVSVTIPYSVMNIGNHAFLNCNQLVVRCKANSYAEDYCKINNIPFEVI